MAQRRAKGLCYNCDEKFVLGHRCKKLFIIKITEATTDDEEIECAALTGILIVPGISLHAITGVRARGIQTMKVYAVAIAHLDSGSSQNFIDIDMARAGVTLQPSAHLSVAVANSDRVSSPGKIAAQIVYIGGGGAGRRSTSTSRPFPSVWHVGAHTLGLFQPHHGLCMRRTT